MTRDFQSFLSFRCSLFAFNMACTERLSQILETFPSAGGMQWKEGWEKSGVIGDKVKEIPMAEATVAFNGWNVKPGEWIKTEMVSVIRNMCINI